MYLLYVGVLVVFVVILFTISSQIRKAAKLAFESEIVETEEFTIVKPEGFISPITDESEYLFEAYSKDFGAGDAGNLRKAQIFVKGFANKNFADACAQAGQGAGNILSEEVSGKTCLIKGEETLKNASAYNFYKVIESSPHQKVYELKISVLKDSLADYQNRVDEITASFQLK